MSAQASSEARLASLARFWKSGQYSDVRLHLLCEPPPPQPAPQEPQLSNEQAGSSAYVQDSQSSRCKVARLSAGAATAPESSSALVAAVASASRTYHLHAVPLASASGYFSTLLALRTIGASSLPAAVVEHVEECELDAMEAVLRHCYTGQLCEEGGDAAELGPLMLLQMMALSSRFDIPACLTHSCDELILRDPASQYDIAFLNAVLADLTPEFDGQPRFDGVEYMALLTLEHRFGDAEAVGCAACANDADKRTSGIIADLRQLSQPALMALLSCQLEVRSDNSVLMLVDAWMGGEVGAGCTAGQRRQVVERLCLGQLSPSFVSEVLPALPWLGGLSDVERRSLLRFSGAAGGSRGAPGSSLSLAQGQLVEGGRLAGPGAWYGEPLSRWPHTEELEFHWVLTRAELVMQLRGLRRTGTLQPAHSQWHFYGGYSLRMVLGVRGGGGRKEGEGREEAAGDGGGVVCAGVEVAVRTSGGTCVACPNVAFSARCAVREWRDEAGAYTAAASVGWDGLVDGDGGGLLRLDRLLGRQLEDVAGWAPYLVDGVMRLRCNVLACT